MSNFPAWHGFVNDHKQKGKQNATIAPPKNSFGATPQLLTTVLF